MPDSLKAFANRCRCCLEKFFDDEKISKITNFFEIQFFAFTGEALKESELLSKHVCEFCHSELLRFSVFKKDLIEKQQRLNELLKQQNDKHIKTKFTRKNKKKKHVVTVIEISEDDVENESLKEEEEAEEEEESLMSDSVIANSDDDKDQDFLIVRANGRTKMKPIPKTIKLSLSPVLLAEKFTCDYCQQTFKAKQGLTRHVQSHIANSVPWKCNAIDCDYATSSKIKLNHHKYELHAIPLPLPKGFNSVDKKKLPEIVTPPAVVVPDFSCFCGASFNSMFSLRAHKNRLHGRRNKCTYGCNVQYVKTGHFIRHIQNKHPEKLEHELMRTKSYSLKGSPQLPNDVPVLIVECDKCDFKTLKKSSLKSHLESHLPYEEREKYGCDLCDRMFTRPTSLRVHRETIHEKIRKYKCKLCTVAFKQLGHLNDHVALKHSKNRKSLFKCTLCARSFLKRYMLNRHQRGGHKVDPKQPNKDLKIGRKFNCFCGKAFPFKSRLLKHQLKHEEEAENKKFKCPAEGCPNTFTQRCNLIRHQKAKGHLRADEIKNLKYVCTCGEKFFSYRGYEFHCSKTKCKKKKSMKFNSTDV